MTSFYSFWVDTIYMHKKASVFLANRIQQHMPHKQEVERRIQTWVYLAPKPVSFHLTLIISENPVRRPVTLESTVVSPNWTSLDIHGMGAKWTFASLLIDNKEIGLVLLCKGHESRFLHYLPASVRETWWLDWFLVAKNKIQPRKPRLSGRLLLDQRRQPGGVEARWPWVQIPVLGKLFNLSDLQFPHMVIGDSRCYYSYSRASTLCWFMSNLA